MTTITFQIQVETEYELENSRLKWMYQMMEDFVENLSVYKGYIREEMYLNGEVYKGEN